MKIAIIMILSVICLILGICAGIVLAALIIAKMLMSRDKCFMDIIEYTTRFKLVQRSWWLKHKRNDLDIVEI